MALLLLGGALQSRERESRGEEKRNYLQGLRMWGGDPDMGTWFALVKQVLVLEPFVSTDYAGRSGPGFFCY